MKKYIVLFLLLISTILFAKVRPGTSGVITLSDGNTYNSDIVSGGSEIEWYIFNNSDISIRAEVAVSTLGNSTIKSYYLNRYESSESETMTGSGNGYPYYYSIHFSVKYGWLIEDRALGAYLVYHTDSWDDNSEYL